MKKILLFLCVIIFSTPCFTQKISTKSFSPISNVVELNGTYLNKDKRLSRLFSIDSDFAHFINFEFNGKDSLKLTYQTSSGLETVSYKGKFKKNYFEIYFAKKQIPIPFFWIEDISRARIGRNTESDLLVQYYDSHMGWVLILMGGGSGEGEYSFQNIRVYEELRPYMLDNKWGFVDSLHNVIIKPQYDFVSFFEDSVSIVKRNDKWGLINKNGMEQIPIKYDTVFFYSKDILKVILHGKKGYLTKSGNEIVPPIYDEIYHTSNNLIKIVLKGKEGYLDENGNDLIPPVYERIGYFTNSDSIVRFSQNGKYGYRTTTGIVCPPIFSIASDKFSADLKDICEFSKNNKTPYAKVKYKGEDYLVDEEGYVYRYKCSRTVRKELIVYEESKIKAIDLK
ncbi:MAG: WG repeat-containing protein [Dysgonamonadaceae bacterium]|jgi:hypothetical protein|nr:WG repeat-containing protein [Dysgonamonadaceae bacterium]